MWLSMTNKIEEAIEFSRKESSGKDGLIAKLYQTFKGPTSLNFHKIENENYKLKWKQ